MDYFAETGSRWLRWALIGAGKIEVTDYWVSWEMRCREVIPAVYIRRQADLTTAWLCYRCCAVVNIRLCAVDL